MRQLLREILNDLLDGFSTVDPVISDEVLQILEDPELTKEYMEYVNKHENPNISHIIEKLNKKKTDKTLDK